MAKQAAVLAAVSVVYQQCSQLLIVKTCGRGGVSTPAQASSTHITTLYGSFALARS
jgi:hypothetical protein